MRGFLIAFILFSPFVSAWSPSEIRVVCATAGCPKQVGLLVFVEPLTGGKLRLNECTAFLSARDEVTSAAHCDRLPRQKGYFVMQSADNGRVFRELRSVRLRTSGDKSDRPDAIIYRLDEPVQEMNSLTMASGEAVAIEELTAFVVEAVNSAGRYEITARHCRQRRHEAVFPYNLSERPDVVISFGCKLEHGHSGAPMFGRDLTVVEAVHGNISTDLGGMSYAANVRCLERGSGCVRVTVAESRRRQKRVSEEAFKDFLNQTRPDTRSFVLRLRGEEPEFEMWFQPSCRERGPLNEVRFVSEHYQLSYNEWAEPRFSMLERRESRARVESQDGDRFVLNMEWAPPFGRLEKPAQDPRRKLGSRFPFELPLCARYR